VLTDPNGDPFDPPEVYGRIGVTAECHQLKRQAA